ncbi:DUF2188 domain-containing protein [Cupriavidus sp. 2TAF22]|uniref:DUF2188 domain-containing protein n=1 Tax=unclassified Cupriavidus TaxID=2640874 RepID=UPI003F92D70F
MSIATVSVVLTEESHWAVESSDNDGVRIKYASRGEAISAGLQMAIDKRAVLKIHARRISPESAL